jgi:hypothetical protein
LLSFLTISGDAISRRFMSSLSRKLRAVKHSGNGSQDIDNSTENSRFELQGTAGAEGHPADAMKNLVNSWEMPYKVLSSKILASYPVFQSYHDKQEAEHGRQVESGGFCA